MTDGPRPDVLALGAPITVNTQITTRPSATTIDYTNDDVIRQSSSASGTPSGSEDRHHSSGNDIPTATEGPWMSGVTLTGDAENESRLIVPAHLAQVHEKRSAASSTDVLTDLGQRVSVKQGREDFARLERRFSQLSQESSQLQRTGTRGSFMYGFAKPERVLTTASSAAPDVEKSKTEDDDFDLAAVLRSGRDLSDKQGIKHKSVGVVWEDLEVIGAGGMKINIRNFASAISEQFIMPVIGVLGLFGYKPFAAKPKTILHKTSGSLQPGEMCLVLGRPGAGCSTFLKSIANQRDGFLTVNGDVQYAGVGWKEMAKTYSG